MTSPLINVMSAAVIKAAKGLQRDFGEVDKLQVSRKGTSNFVTKTDLRAEKNLMAELKKARPDYGFLAEESGETPGADASYRWIIDPLDGTSNFIHAIPYFCISIALERSDEKGNSDIVAAVTYDPINNELFHAERGHGAFLNNRRIVVSQRKTIDELMLVTGSPHHLPALGTEAFSLLRNMSTSGACVRYFGATALDLAHLAAGRVDGVWYGRMQPWDIAAGILLVREAGGMATDYASKPATIASSTLMASSAASYSFMAKQVEPFAAKPAA